MTGQREEIERLIGEAYAALRERNWSEFESKVSEVKRYEWPEVEFIIHEKMMRASPAGAMNLAFIYDEITAEPFSIPQHSGHHSPSPVYPEITWEWVGGFYNGEAYFGAAVREYTYYGYKRTQLYTTVEVGQKDRTVLDKINAFLEKNLGAIGRVRYYPARDIHILYHKRVEDCYRTAKKVLPHLHLPARRNQAQKLIDTTLSYARKQFPIERGRHRIALAKRWERILELNAQNPSRWVLEMWPPDVVEWRKTFAYILRAPLTTREQELIRSFEDYLRRKAYLTARQVEVTRSIAKRHGVEVPAIPVGGK